MVKGANFVIKGTNAAGPAMQQFNNQLQQVQRTTQRMAPINQSWNRGLSENRRAVQQLGFQLTDFTVQIAGGQNAMLAFIQQGGQMLQVFGPMGAVLATLLTVFGTLALVLGKSGQSLNEFIPLLGVLQVDLQFLVDAFRVFADYMIVFANLVANNLDVLLVAVGIWVGRWVAGLILTSSAVTGFGVTLATLGPVMGGVTIATQILTGSLVALRAVLMTVLPVALLIGVAWLVTKFIELVQATGSLGAALRAVGQFATDTFFAMQLGAEGFSYAVVGVTEMIKSHFVAAFSYIAQKWGELVGWIAGKFNSMMETIGSDLRMKVEPPKWIADIGTASADAAAASAKAFETSGWYIDQSFGEVGRAWGDLTSTIKDNPIDIRDMFKGGGGGALPGGGGGGGKPEESDALKELKAQLQAAKALYEDFSKTVADGMMANWKAVVTGAKSLKEAAIDMLGTVLDKVQEIIMQPIFNAAAGWLTKTIFGFLGLPSFAGGGPTGRGARAGGLDGKGGFMAMLHPNETVIDHTMGTGGKGGGAGGVVTVVIQEAPGFAAAVQTHAEGVAVRVVRDYDRSVLPASVKRINNDPHRR